MFTKKIITAILPILLISTSTNISFAHKYNNNYQNYPPPGYYPVEYSQNGYYNNDTGLFNNEKLKKTLKYAAVGAGAGYLFSPEHKKLKSSLVGAGIGTAFSLLLD